MNRKAAFTAVGVWVMVSSVSVPAERPGDDLFFLVGDWVGGGSGQPGKGAGSFSFTHELQGRVLVRSAHSEYPAGPGRTATIHDEVLIVYADHGKAEDFKSHLAGAAMRKKPQRP